MFSYEDIITLATALSNKARATASLVTARLDTFGLASDQVVVVSPGETPEGVELQIMSAIAA